MAIDVAALPPVQRAALSAALRRGAAAPARALEPPPRVAPAPAPQNAPPRSPRTPAAQVVRVPVPRLGVARRSGGSSIGVRLVWAIGLGLLTLEVISQMTGRYFSYDFKAPWTTLQERAYVPLVPTSTPAPATPSSNIVPAHAMGAV